MPTHSFCCVTFFMSTNSIDFLRGKKSYSSSNTWKSILSHRGLLKKTLKCIWRMEITLIFGLIIDGWISTHWYNSAWYGEFKFLKVKLVILLLLLKNEIYVTLRIYDQRLFLRRFIWFPFLLIILIVKSLGNLLLKVNFLLNNNVDQ